MTWMGWQGYETPILAGTFLKDNDIDFQPTFISSNEEIITKLQAGGTGRTDLITMYFGYLPLMAEGGLLEPVDSSKIEQFGDLIPQFTSQEAIRHDGNLLGVPWNWGSLPLMYDPAVVTTASDELARHHEAGAREKGRDGRRPARQSSGLGHGGDRQADGHHPDQG